LNIRLELRQTDLGSLGDASTLIELSPSKLRSS
jgi:hypothetical protein